MSNAGRAVRAPGGSEPSARGWWLTFGRGLVALCLGLALLVAAAGQSRLATFIGVYWLLGSVLTLRWVSRSPDAPGRRLGALAAGIGAGAALALLARRPLDDLVGMTLVIDLVGAGAIATGTMRMLGAFRDDDALDDRTRRRHNTLIGAFDVGLGIALIVASDATSAWVRFVAAAWGLVGGTFLVLDSLRLRRLGRSATVAKIGGTAEYNRSPGR